MFRLQLLHLTKHQHIMTTYCTTSVGLTMFWQWWRVGATGPGGESGAFHDPAEGRDKDQGHLPCGRQGGCYSIHSDLQLHFPHVLYHLKSPMVSMPSIDQQVHTTDRSTACARLAGTERQNAGQACRCQYDKQAVFHLMNSHPMPCASLSRTIVSHTRRQPTWLVVRYWGQARHSLRTWVSYARGCHSVSRNHHLDNKTLRCWVYVCVICMLLQSLNELFESPDPKS